MVSQTPATAEQFENALSGRYGGTPLRFRFTRRTRQNALIDDVSSAIVGSVSVECDNERAVRMAARMTFDAALAPEDFDPAHDIIGVAVEVFVQPVADWVSLQVGLFMLDSAERQYPAQGTESVLIPAEGADLTMLLVRQKRSGPYTIPAGTAFASALGAILDSHGLAYELPTTGETLSAATSWAAGSTDWQIAADLCFGVNWLPLYADRFGVIRTRPRIPLSDEPVAVVYRDTDEPIMLVGTYATSQDSKPANRVGILLPAAAGSGSIEVENIDADAPNSTRSLAFGTAVDLDHNSADSPTLVTAAANHELGSEQQALILGVEDSDLEIDGTYPVTVVTPTTFTVPVAVTVGGTGGTVQPTVLQRVEFKPDGTPSTKAVVDATKAEEIAASELRWAAAHSHPTRIGTFIDPRRGPHECVGLEVEGVESGEVYAVHGWSMELAPGAVMQHRLGRILGLDDLLTLPRNGGL